MTFTPEDHRTIRVALARYRVGHNDYQDAYQEALIALWRCGNDSPAYRNVVVRHAVLNYVTGTALPFGYPPGRRRYPVKEEHVGDLTCEEDVWVLGEEAPSTEDPHLQEMISALSDPHDRMIAEATAHGLQFQEISQSAGFNKGWAAHRWRSHIRKTLASSL